MYVKIGDKEVECAPGFQLFLHTKLSNPHYPPEIQAETTSKLLSHFPLQHPACREGRSPRHERAAGPGPRGPGPRPAAGPGLPGQGAGPAHPPRPAPWRPLQPPSGGPGGMLLRHLTQPEPVAGSGAGGEEKVQQARRGKGRAPGPAQTEGVATHQPHPTPGPRASRARRSWLLAHHRTGWDSSRPPPSGSCSLGPVPRVPRVQSRDLGPAGSRPLAAAAAGRS